MGERVGQIAKAPEVKQSNSNSRVRKTERLQSMDTPVERILFLQRTAGNQAVSRLMRSGALQAKLRIGPPGDVYEREADRVADAVMRMPEPGVQRQVEPEEEEEETLQTKPLAGQITPLGQRQPEPVEEEEELQETPVFPKLTVGAPDDEYERQADQVADKVMRMPDSDTSQILEEEEEQAVQNDLIRTKPITPLYIQRACSERDEEIQSKSNLPTVVQAKPDGSFPPSKKVAKTLQSSDSGSPLPKHVRSKVEPVLDSDLSHVKIHSDTNANQAAQSINAKAFAHQNNIYLGKGQSANNLPLMAHESTHVVQNSSANNNISTVQRLNESASSPKASNLKSSTLTLGTKVRVSIAGKKRIHLPGTASTEFASSHQNNTHVNLKEESGTEAGVPLFLQRFATPHVESEPIEEEKVKATGSNLVQRSELSDSIEQLWRSNNTKEFYAQLQSIGWDPDVIEFVEFELTGDALWAARNCMALGNPKDWPVHLRIEGLIRGHDLLISGGHEPSLDVIEKIRNILVKEGDKHAGNAMLLTVLNNYIVDNLGYWVLTNIVDYGAETKWPLDLQMQLAIEPWFTSSENKTEQIEQVYDILRATDGAEANNKDVWRKLDEFKKNGTLDCFQLFHAIALVELGAESNWPEMLTKVMNNQNELDKAAINDNFDPSVQSGFRNFCRRFKLRPEVIEIDESLYDEALLNERPQNENFEDVPTIDADEIEPIAVDFDLSGSFGVVIHVIDKNDVIKEGIDIGAIEISDANNLVFKVLKKAGKHKINALHIHGHGNEGQQSIGSWTGFAPEKTLHRYWLKDLRDTLGMLKGHFTSDGEVVLHGCYVGLGKEGAYLMSRLAEVWGVPVRASTGIQVDEKSGLEGPEIVTCYPPTKKWTGEVTRRDCIKKEVSLWKRICDALFQL